MNRKFWQPIILVLTLAIAIINSACSGSDSTATTSKDTSEQGAVAAQGPNESIKAFAEAAKARKEGGAISEDALREKFMQMAGPGGKKIGEQLEGVKDEMQQGAKGFDVDDLPYPVYPGARIVSGREGAVSLVTGDELSKVDEFYRQQLEGKEMVRKEMMGIIAYIPQGKDTPEYTIGSTPGVMYSAGGEDLDPKAKTRIDMAY